MKIENFLLKTKFLHASFPMIVSRLPSYETTHTEQGSVIYHVWTDSIYKDISPDDYGPDSIFTLPW